MDSLLRGDGGDDNDSLKVLTMMPSKKEFANDESDNNIELEYAHRGEESWGENTRTASSSMNGKVIISAPSNTCSSGITLKHPIVKSCSESDLRILSNPNPKFSILSNDSNAFPKIGAIRSDYVTIAAASKRGENVGLHSFRKKIIHQNSCVCRHGDSKNGTNTVVVIPSIDLDGDELKRICPNIEFYEERQLYHLLLLADPSFRVVFLSTYQICEDIVRYYLSLDNCTSDELNERRQRLFLLTPGDLGSPHTSLSKKVVNHDKLISTIREIVDRSSRGDSPLAGLNVFCGSDTADQLASKLKLRLLEASGENLYYGSKQGSREIFQRCKVPHAPGTPDIDDDDLLSSLPNASTCIGRQRFIRSPEALSLGIARQIVMKNVKPKRWVVKLNQGFSGKGNAKIDLQDVQEKVYLDSCGNALKGEALVERLAIDILNRLPAMKFECPSVSWDGNEFTGYRIQIEKLGVIAEAFLEGDDFSSPSVQAIIEPDEFTGQHVVHVTSSHEQVLNGQVYNGCINPASDNYRDEILSHTRRIGNELAGLGVVGHFGVDFLTSCSKSSDGKTIYYVNGIEINLRQGGTTHPFATMTLLTGGYTGDDGIFRTADGNQRCYVATDAHIDDALIGMTSKEFLRTMEKEENNAVRWDSTRNIGVIFHILDFLQLGKVGFTAISTSPMKARKLFDETTHFLKQLASRRSSSGDIS